MKILKTIWFMIWAHKKGILLYKVPQNQVQEKNLRDLNKTLNKDKLKLIATMFSIAIPTKWLN